MKQALHKEIQGAAALVTVVTIMAATLIIGLSVSSLGLGELERGYTAQRGTEALTIADGCAEETLRRIRRDISYGVGRGNINLTVNNGTCTITVADIGGGGRNITVIGTSGEYNKKIEVEITLSGNVITIDSWEEKEN
jgi:hypothetical protein